MSEAATDPVRDVTLLMLVRVMPETDFQRLCEVVLNGDANTSTLTAGGETCLDAGGRLRTLLDTLCACCGQVAEDDPLNLACVKATGVRACKACIDDALGAIFGPEPEHNVLVRAVLTQAAVGSHA
jgi:hypothetical protein